MLTPDDLMKKLRALEQAPAQEYARIVGTYDFDDFLLTFEQVPDRPERYPARVRVTVPRDSAKFPKDVFTPKSREIAARDYIARLFASQAPRFSISQPGIRGGAISIETPVREVLELSAVVVGDNSIEARFTVELPVQRGRISCQAARELLMKKVPALVRNCLMFPNVDGEKLADWIETVEDAEYLRGALVDRGLVAFVADSSILPRRTSLTGKGIVPFNSPDGLAVTLDLPNRGSIRGMGIPKGITLITGGVSHGKTTLLRAIELGVFNHHHGDGREFVVTVPDAVGIRVEEGRRIEQVDISPIIGTIAANIDTKKFSSRSAPPAASLAANLMEALEIGTSLLLFDDENITANMVGNDGLMQKLVPPGDSAAYGLVDILPRLRDEHGISSIMVGGSGDFFAVADTVITMKDFVCRDATAEAKRITEAYSTRRVWEHDKPFPLPAGRCPLTHSLEPFKTERDSRSRPQMRRYVKYGDEYIDVSNIAQIIGQAQGRGISRGIAMVFKMMNSSRSLSEAVHHVMKRVEKIGPDALSNRHMGDLSSFRAYELAAVINRLKNLKIQ